MEPNSEAAAPFSDKKKTKLNKLCVKSSALFQLGVGEKKQLLKNIKTNGKIKSFKWNSNLHKTHVNNFQFISTLEQHIDTSTYFFYFTFITAMFKKSYLRKQTIIIEIQ